MKLWPKPFDNFLVHLVALGALWAGKFALDRFVFPAKPWMPSESAWAGPIEWALMSAIFAVTSLTFVYMLRVALGVASSPFGRRVGGPMSPWSPGLLFQMLVGGMVPAMTVFCAAEAVFILRHPDILDGATARNLFLAIMAAVWPASSLAFLTLYARAARRIGAEPAEVRTA